MNYYKKMSCLFRVKGNVSGSNANYDIDTQQPNNYRYDRVGNLILDRSERIALRWTDYGKLKQIYYVEPFTIAGQTLYLPFTKLNFTYDVLGNRLTKSYYQKDLLGSSRKYTDIYIRDIQGNVIANYQIRNDSLFLTELPIYGAERLGVLRTNKFLKKKQLTGSSLLDLSEILQQLDAEEVQPIHPYRRLYELTDWLGNVRVVISDRKYPVSYNPLRYVADVRKVTDYYSYGMGIAERSYERWAYSYGFNTQERVEEINDNHYTARYWEYDTRIGKRWNVDPKNNFYLSSYAVFTLNPIIFNDVNGDTVRYRGLRERIDVLISRILSKAFREEFRHLKESRNIYEYRRIEKGGQIEFKEEKSDERRLYFEIQYEKSNPYESDLIGKSRYHALFEETFHAVDYELGRSSSMITGPDEEGRRYIGHLAGDLMHEARAWVFAANYAPFAPKNVYAKIGYRYVYTKNSLIQQIKALKTTPYNPNPIVSKWLYEGYEIEGEEYVPLYKMIYPIKIKFSPIYEKK